MEPRSPLPGPRRLLLVLPDERLAEKALRSGMAVWVVTDPTRHGATWLRTVRERAELVLVEGARDDLVAEVAAETARRNGIAHVLPTRYGGVGQPAARLLADTRAVRRLLAESGRLLVPCLVAESRAGPELVVSTLTTDGMHRAVGITERTAEGYYVHPATLFGGDRAAVAAAVTSLLDLADHEFGPAETEVALTTRGPCPVTARPCFGSHHIPRLIELASGFDVQTGLLRALQGERLTAPRTDRFAALDELSLPPGLPPTGTDEIAALPGVAEVDLDVAEGGLHGFVMVSGRSARQVTERLGTVRLALETWR